MSDDGAGTSMTFELGRTYRHTTGRVLRVVAEAASTTYAGSCLIAEDQRTGEFTPVGASADAAANWTDITPDPTTAVQRYRKRPVVVEAIRWDGSNWGAVCAFLGVPEHGHGDMATLAHTDREQRMDIVIHTLEGDMRAALGDYLIKGVKRECYPCKPDVFDRSYDMIHEPSGAGAGP